MAEQVKDIMSKDLVTISKERSALEAAKIMTDKGVSSLIVLSGDQPVGIVTERDFIKKICLKELQLSEVQIGHIMSKIRTYATPDTSIEVAVQRMINNRIRRLPIIDDDKLVGIVTVTDLAKHLRTILLLDGALSLQ
ncbi:MAG TPA: CBS domain-containing protein [Nitrososphaeraceae archaeon]|nr:CBS domain-containing protein [Nitrososphaeraceae archaeon]